jgi:arylsulfatase A-like enzyme
MEARRRARQPYFLFLNLYDVHAPYAPTATSPLRPFRSLDGWIENLLLPGASVRLGGHAYLRAGFRFSDRVRRMLERRYHDAIALMDEKVGRFWSAAKDGGLLDDTMLIVVSDHGEAFGDHGLYFHDASVYQTHLHVPLLVHHPDADARVVDETVSTRDLFTLVRTVALDGTMRGTLLDPNVPASAPVALSEHFFYPHVRGMAPRYAQNLAAAVAGSRKLIVRREGTFSYDLASDPDEQAPEPLPVSEFAVRCRRDGVPQAAVADALAHLRRWDEARSRSVIPLRDEGRAARPSFDVVSASSADVRPLGAGGSER